MTHFSQRIGQQNAMISAHPTNIELCYQWTKSGRVNIEGVQRYTCAGCRSVIFRMKQEGAQNLQSAPSRFAVGHNWSKEEVAPHVCGGKQKSDIEGIQVRREIQAQVAQGGNESTNSARIRINTKITTQFANNPVN